jgi:hypothetical protein
MKKIQVYLTVAIAATALLLIAFFGASLLGASISFLYGGVPSFSLVRSITQISASLAALVFLVASGMVAVAAALQPASWLRRLLYVVPAYLILLTLAGLILYFLRIGTTGAVNLGFGQASFTLVWIALCAVLSAVTVVIAAARLSFTPRVLKVVLGMVGISSLFSLVAALGVIASLAIVLTSQPSRSFSGGFEGARPRPGEGQGGFQPGFGERGGFGGLATAARSFEIGGGLMVLFTAAALFGSLSGWRAQGAATFAASQQVQSLDLRRQGAPAFLSLVGVAVITLALIQLVPVSHTDPPVQTVVQWDSPQSQQLWTRACASCHSNQTQWPWFTYVAPGSWLTVVDVNSGRQRFNLSQLTRRGEGANEAGGQIRNGSMPPPDYLLLHPEARLTDAEKQQLIQALQTVQVTQAQP